MTNSGSPTGICTCPATSLTNYQESRNESMNSNMLAAANLHEPWTKPWPVDGLELVPECPICGQSERKILHIDLVDNVFRVAPGKWSLWECAKCGSAYLDPRPTQTTIHLAYSDYYTHQGASEKVDYASLSPLRKLRRRLVNGYTNWRYSTHADPFSALGVLAAFAMPNLKKVLDYQYRHMPRLPHGGGVLLDVGCGDGAFLCLARACGWNVVGLDPDPKAVACGAKQGLTVYEGGIEYFDNMSEVFDVITLNNVIEHLHDPIKVLKSCYALLKPGGQLWLETPNINSFGHARFKKNWRGLETPRHLILFNRNSLNQAFVSAGFTAPNDCARPTSRIYWTSFALELGCSPYQKLVMPKLLLWQAKMAAYAEVLLLSRREFLTVVVRKAEK